MTARVGRIIPLGWALLVPLVLWTGFADPVETPKRLVLAVLAVGAWTLAVVDPAGRARLAAHPLALPLLVVSAVTTLSAVSSGAPRIAWAGEEGSWTGAAQQVTVWLGAVAVAALAPAGTVRRGAAALVASSVIALLWAVGQAFGSDPVAWDRSSVNRYWLFATLGNPVHLAAVLVAGCCVAPAAFRPGVPVGWWVSAALLGGAVATRQRSVWIALASAMLVVAWMRGMVPRGQPGRRFSVGRRGIAVAAVAVVVALVAAERSVDGSRLFGLGRLGSRPHIWAGVARIWRADPVLGAGPDLIHLHFVRHATYDFFVADPPVVRGADVDLRLPGSAHSEGLQMAATVGVLGAGAWLWALVVAVRAAGRPAPLLPAAAALLGAQLVNPASAATGALLWWLLALGAGTRGPDRRAAVPARAGERIVAAAGAALLLAALVTAWRNAAGQAHLREAGRLAFFADAPGLAGHLHRWDAAAAGWHPRFAQADAARWRSLATGAEAGAARRRAAGLLGIARDGDPRGLFPLCAAADLALATGRAGDRAALRDAEALLREAIGRAPAVASLHADLAAVLEAAGRPAAARAALAVARLHDPAGIFRPRPDR